jgi:molybdopterin molybdotransferase
MGSSECGGGQEAKETTNFRSPRARFRAESCDSMLTPNEAERLIRESIAPFHREDCPIGAAHGRILREDLRADRDLPPCDRVTMDGYALRASSLAAGTRSFRIEGVQAAGMVARTLGAAADACVEIMTGAVLPVGADCIVPYEETARAANGTTVNTSETAGEFTSGHAVHRRGGDHRSGEVIVRAGTRLTGREIAVAAACGYATVTVTRLPKIAVVTSGDELVEVEAAVAPHQIRRSNDQALRAALALAGFPKVERFHVRDVRHEIEHLLWHLLAEYDVLLITGGVSKGKFDFLPEELTRQGVKKIFHGVAQRPGKPFWFGLSSRSTPVFALPGNPVSSYTCLHRYVLPSLAHASGHIATVARTVALAAPVTFKPKLACLMPVKLSSGPRAELLATPDEVNTSGDFAGLVGTDGFVELPADQNEFPAGTVVPFTPWA